MTMTLILMTIMVVFAITMIFSLCIALKLSHNNDMGSKKHILISKFRIYGGMTKPAFLFDGRKILDHDVRNFTHFQTSILSALKLSQPNLLFEGVNFLNHDLACPNQSRLASVKN